jgi:glycosyltransferase involved in cell wall biosynthesis
LLRVPRADLYYLHGFYQYPGLALRNAFHRAPFVYDAHDFYSILTYGSRWQRRVERRIERACVGRAAAVVTVSDGVADLYEQHFGRRPVVLRNAHDERLDTEPASTVRSATGVSGTDFLVVLVGQWKAGITPLELVIEAAAKCTEPVHVAFLGPGFPSSCGAWARSAGVGDRVHFLPGVEPSEIVPFISDADTGAVLYRPTNASVAACLPNGFYQVLAAGLPVVFATDLPMVAAAAGDVGLAVDGDDPQSVASAFDRLAGDVALRDRLRASARAGREGASWVHEEAKLGALVSGVLASKSTRGNGPAATPAGG